jgi:hypothetical protein
MRLGLYFVIVFSFIAHACAYKFSNLNVHSNPVQTVYVESVYDTSKADMPSQVLWEEVQKAVITSGRYTLANAKDPALVLRMQIRDLSEVKIGSRADFKGELADPAVFEEGKPLPDPSSLRDLSTARDYYTGLSKRFQVDVELWNRGQKKMVLQRSYDSKVDYPTVLSDSGPKSGFREVTGLRVQESFEHGFRESARRLAEVIVDDISN